MVRRGRSQPRWADANEGDLGIAILEVFDYVGDLLSSYQDQIAKEARLRTRRRLAVALGAVAVLFFGSCAAQRRRGSDRPVL